MKSYSEVLTIYYFFIYIYFFQDVDSLPADTLIDWMFSATFHSRLLYPSPGPFFSLLIFVPFTSVSLVRYHKNIFQVHLHRMLNIIFRTQSRMQNDWTILNRVNNFVWIFKITNSPFLFPFWRISDFELFVLFFA